MTSVTNSDDARCLDMDTLERLRARDPKAFEEVYEEHRASIFRFLCRLSGNPAIADELSQETWLRLARHAPKLRPDTHLRGWLYTVARNAWRSHQRWAWVDGTRLLELAERLTQASPSPYDQVSSAQGVAWAEQTLATLSPTLREVAILVLWSGFTPQEAAVVLGASNEAVRQRLARARQALELGVPR